MVKIHVTQDDISDTRSVPNRYKGALCDSVFNPVSFAIARQCEHTTAFIDWQHIQAVREQSYWLATPDEVKKWLNTFNQWLILESQVELSKEEARSLAKMEAELIPFTFELALPKLTAAQIKAAKAHKAAFIESLEKLNNPVE